MSTFVTYSDDVEVIAADEAETHRKIVEVMTDGLTIVREKLGKAVRISHGKSFAAVTGTLTIPSGLDSALAQGLFAKPGSYEVVVRFAAAPGEINDDSKLSTGQGLAIKIFGVDGAKIAPFEDISTQDFVLNTGKEFFTKNAETFLPTFTPNAKIATRLSDDVKGAVSDFARGTNAMLKAVGVESPKLAFFGKEKIHPLAQEFYSQTPSRYGSYIAKLGVIPASAALKALADVDYDPKTPNALREAALGYFSKHDAEYDVVVQLNTSLSDMPVEDAMAPWSEELSPYRKVATLTLPSQDSYDERHEEYVDENLSFSPAHTLEAHRPIGSINRARLVVYTALSNLRRRDNGRPTTEPSEAGQVPA